MCNDFLDSYNQSLQVCKVSSIPWTYYIQNTMPKSAKSRFGFLRPLGVNFEFYYDLLLSFTQYAIIFYEIQTKITNILLFFSELQIIIYYIIFL
jgi:hypothetical protein